MLKNWVLKEPISLKLKKEFPEIPSLILQLLCNRGLKTQKQIDEFLNPDYGQDILDPFLFSDMKKTVSRIYDAVAKNEKITIHGDYDADGVSSTVLLSDVLAVLGANFDVYIPHREKEGYGLNPQTIEYLVKNKTKLIITVDCAISNVAEVQLANKNGIDVIITDHHHEPKELPKAYAIINPKVKKCHYPFYELAGVGVAFKLAQAIISSDSQKVFQPGYEKWLLDLVAVGTVADMMPLLGENRTLVKYGLIVLNKTKRIGLRKLAEKAGIWPITEQALINSDNIGFMLGPRINAAGRMDHANSAYKLLLSSSATEAEKLADDLEKNNQQRQNLTDKIINQVKVKIKDLDKQYLIIAESKDWPLGIIGLAANRIKDEINRPVLIISELGGKIVGSGRSIPELNLIESLDKVSGLFEIYGGHAAAAGFTLKNKKCLAEFKKKFLEIVKKELDNKDLRPKLEIEAELNLEELNWELFDQIEKFEPFGAANRKPSLLVKDLLVDSLRTVGNDDKHLKLFLKHQNMIKGFDAIGFGMGSLAMEIRYGDKVDVVCEIYLNEFNGTRKLELRLIDIKNKGNNNLTTSSKLAKKRL